mgnify:CR=1 FL=1
MIVFYFFVYMKSQLYTFYNDTYHGTLASGGRPSIAELYLCKYLYQFGEIKVSVTNGGVQKLKDIWEVKFYDGSLLTQYRNAFSASQQVTLLAFSKVLVVTEYKQKDVGIRFYTSLTDDEVVIDLLTYVNSSKTEPGDRTDIHKRFSGKLDMMLCPKNLVNVFNEAQRLSYEVIDLNLFYCN